MCGHAKLSGLSTVQAVLAKQHKKWEDGKILKPFCFKLVVHLQLFVSPSSLIIVGSLIFEAFTFGNALYEKLHYKNKCVGF